MSLDDFGDLLALASGGRGAPCLVELGRALRPGSTTTGYAWSSGRVVATVGPGSVRIRRRFGVVRSASGTESDLTLDRAALSALLVACRDWAARRDGWAAFYFSQRGYPGGFGAGASWYQPPGKSEKRTKIGERMRGVTRGEELRGENVVVPLATPVALEASVRINAEIWRRGESHGPAEGSLVGVRYQLGDGGGVFVAEREGGEVRLGGRAVHLEAGEENFVAALVDVTKE